MGLFCNSISARFLVFFNKTQINPYCCGVLLQESESDDSHSWDEVSACNFAGWPLDMFIVKSVLQHITSFILNKFKGLWHILGFRWHALTMACFSAAMESCLSLLLGFGGRIGNCSM